MLLSNNFLSLQIVAVKEVGCHADVNIWDYFNKDARINKVKFLLGSSKGEKFPDLKGLAAWDCALTVLRAKHFKGLKKLRYLNLVKNEFCYRGKNVFKDLTNMDYLGLD